jgi:hypothetical protein
VVEVKGDVRGWVLVTVAGLPGVVTTEAWEVAIGVVSVVVGACGVEDGVGWVEGSGGVLLCTGLEEGDGGVREGDTGVGVGLGVDITGDGVVGDADEGEGWTTLDGAEAGAVEKGKKTWSVRVRRNEQIEDQQ